MAEWSREKVDPSDLNNGNEWEQGDRVARQELNAMVNAGLYTQDFAEHLADTPDTSDAGSIGTPSVTLIDNVVNGITYKKFKFSNLKGEKGDKGDTGLPGGSNPNLLINGDFKVNQRGFTSVETTSTNNSGIVYTIDRWMFRSTSNRQGKLEVNSNGGLDFTCYSATISIAQILESADTERLKGKTVTATIKVSAITGNSPLQLWIRDDSSWGNYGQINITSTGTYSVTGTIPTDVAGNVLVYISYDNFQDQTTASIDWVKLEVGSQSTDFSPRPYAEELAMCQRYFINIPADLTGYSGYTANNGDYAIITVPLPAPMRTIPTITVKNLGYLRLNGQLVAPTQILVSGITNNCLKLRCNATVSVYYTICLMQAGFELDAEVY